MKHNSRFLALILILSVSACGQEARREQGEPAGEQPGTAASPAPESAAVGGMPARPVPPETAFAGTFAITIDDLPWVGALPPGESRLQPTGRLLGALRKHDATAVGFVDCARVGTGAPVLRLWLDDGHTLGNHTANHVDLDRADPSAWIAAARSCDSYLRKLTGDSILYFRYPYLHRGRTAERYRVGRQAIDQLDERVAPVTIVTLDWLLAAAYGNALRAGDTARMREIGAEFVDHVTRTTAHYQEVAQERVGRDVAHVLLLHANALVSEYLDEVLARLHQDGLRPVTLEQALQDPVYARPDDYIGPEGISWLYRFEPAAPELAAWDKAEEARLRARFPR